VECIVPGTPVEQWPTYYIDPATCIDCGACVPECPYAAIFPQDEVPSAYQAKGDELINQIGLKGRYEAQSHHGQNVVLNTTRVLRGGEVVNLSESIQTNASFFK
jgi:ferredoxin